MKINFKNSVLIFIVIVKVLTFVWLLSYPGVNVIKGFWGFSSTELLSGHILGIENFLKTGNYTPDERMPGYGFAYMLPKLFTDRATACNILIVFSTYYGNNQCILIS